MALLRRLALVRVIGEVPLGIMARTELDGLDVKISGQGYGDGGVGSKAYPGRGVAKSSPRARRAGGSLLPTIADGVLPHGCAKPSFHWVRYRAHGPLVSILCCRELDGSGQA